TAKGDLDLALTAYALAQRAFRHQLASRPVPAANQPDPRWLISDLVTLGSPLTHAEFLIAADQADLERRVAARELPQSPPYRERLYPNVPHRAQATHAMPIVNPPDQTRLMSYPVVNTDDSWALHHAAPFAKGGFGHPTCLNNPDPSTLPPVK